MGVSVHQKCESDKKLTNKQEQNQMVQICREGRELWSRSQRSNGGLGPYKCELNTLTLIILQFQTNLNILLVRNKDSYNNAPAMGNCFVTRDHPKIRCAIKKNKAKDLVVEADLLEQKPPVHAVLGKKPSDDDEDKMDPTDASSELVGSREQAFVAANSRLVTARRQVTNKWYSWFDIMTDVCTLAKEYNLPDYIHSKMAEQPIVTTMRGVKENQEDEEGLQA
ncbi:hypothetical protein BDV93DRAFT_515271 [Ceratobasidium sp. AG-I]|nr:hypothetical protein BDV93DRAFT_515271 [Ceratobasidium sp. AG-I]